MSDSETPKVGVIGGSGLYSIEQIENINEIEINTQHIRHIITTNELFNYMLEISNSLNKKNIILDSITNN